MSSGKVYENSENTCVVCFKNVSIYSVGECDHAVCYECSTRMRVLCRQNECPICRQDMPKVIFTKEVKPFRSIRDGHYLMDKKFRICFENQGIQAAYNKLLEHVCTVCPGSPAFRTFQSLKDHMRKTHELHYCDLCVDNLKIFTRERRCYTRQELAQHRRKGDPDDRSHRGHPLCEFCDQRYMDNDELYRHLRRDHLYCHFCDADGYHQYYSSYDFLRDHFRAEHFLCEEGGCVEEKFTSVFRSAIDLKAHRASVHGRSLGRAALKQARTLELEFTLAPRPNAMRRGPRSGGGGGGSSGGGGGSSGVGGATGGYVEDSGGELMGFDEGAAAPPPPPPLPAAADFPVLGGSSGAVTVRSLPPPPPPVCRPRRPPVLREEDFPALDSGSSGGTSGPQGRKTVRVSVNGERPSSASNLSISVNRRADGALTTRLSTSRGSRPIPAESGTPREDFPALVRHSDTSSQWSSPIVNNLSNGDPRQSRAQSQPHPRQSSIVKTTGATAKKASSSLLIPMPTSWPVAHNEEDRAPASVSLGTVKVKSKKKKPKGSVTNQVSLDQPPSPCKVANQQDSGTKKKKQSLDNRTKESNINGNVNDSTDSATASVCATSAPERKKSQLLITGLNAANETGGSLPAPPPGFHSTLSPPPGFSVTLSSVARAPSSVPESNGLTFTSSSGRSYAVSAQSSEGHKFVPPPGADHRNRQLVARVAEAVPDLDTFLRRSAEFRRGTLTAREFYDACAQAAGEQTFAEIFPELLLLLPDITKQQELWTVYTSVKSESGKGACMPPLEVCGVCGQVIATDDAQQHKAAHHLDNQFPALGTHKPGTVAAPSTTPTWVRRQ
ncbi:E3 ubiquitin-protein ligase ZNF598 [Schistocerca nitens]|uniref:E3 ubiquitin-protein ligase ZNF598 n=1 Tax=Schistocerca nitens TaxID=7011 RepID=UPI00211759A9|nr:E3 ubiquitin-protein ligase ZNF598 [Schistocerca nitens]